MLKTTLQLRREAIEALDLAVRRVKRYVELTASNDAPAFVGIVPDLLELRHCFESASSPERDS